MEREDRVIYTSYYDNITSAHWVLFFFSPFSLIMQKYKTNKNTQNYRHILKNTNKLYNFSLNCFASIGCRQIDIPKLRRRDVYPCNNFGYIFSKEFMMAYLQPNTCQPGSFKSFKSIKMVGKWNCYLFMKCLFQICLLERLFCYILFSIVMLIIAWCNMRWVQKSTQCDLNSP